MASFLSSHPKINWCKYFTNLNFLNLHESSEYHMIILTAWHQSSVLVIPNTHQNSCTDNDFTRFVGNNVSEDIWKPCWKILIWAKKRTLHCSSTSEIAYFKEWQELWQFHVYCYCIQDPNVSFLLCVKLDSGVKSLCRFNQDF